jgi:exopolysaccharide biosynthesis polyprenyl glycosylphosphotransferase
MEIRRKYSKSVPWSLVLTDCTAVLMPLFFYSGRFSILYPLMMLVMQMVLFQRNGLYWWHARNQADTYQQFSKITSSYVVMFPVFCVVHFASQLFGSLNDATFLLEYYCLTFFSVSLMRMVVSNTTRLFQGWGKDVYLVAGLSDRAKLIANEIGHLDGAVFSGFLAFDRHETELDVIAEYKAIQDVVEERDITHVVLAPPKTSHELLQEYITTASKLDVHTYIFHRKYDVIRKSYKGVYIGNVLVSPVDTSAGGHGNSVLIRALDIFVSSFGLIIASPIILLTAMLVSLTSRGPVIYTSDRVCSRTGDTFRFYKFRSMYIRIVDPATERASNIERNFGGVDVDSENTKTVEKSQITPVGEFIRKWSIDELPQLLNVLKGDMSLVGPRPTTVYEFQKYSEWQKKRLDVKPGVTGLWQAVARSKTNFDDQAILDNYYVDHRSIWLNVEILLLTVPVLFFGRGGG